MSHCQAMHSFEILNVSSLLSCAWIDHEPCHLKFIGVFVPHTMKFFAKICHLLRHTSPGYASMYFFTAKL